MKRFQRWILPIALGLAAAIFLVQYLTSASQPTPWSYTELLDQAQAGQVKSLAISGATGIATDQAGHKYSVALPPDQSVAFADELRADHVVVTFPPGADFGSLLVSFLPNLIILLLVGGLIYWSYRSIQRGQGQAMSFGRSKPRLVSPERSPVTFADVAGVQEAQEELKEVVEFLKTPEKFRALGARIPRGVLMLGPPGSGKTLLAKAVAGEAGVPFFSISGSEFVEMFVGVGASRVRDLFEQAKKSAPCIIFIDEIDAVGRQRGAGLGGGHDEREQTLNQLLVEMDGFDQNTGVILIAATNRPDVLDPALLRPGRFDRQIVVDRADVRGRQAILSVHSKNKPLSKEVSLETLARRTPGFSGADLENLLNEAALLAARRNKSVIEMTDCDEAIDRVLVGPERKSVVMSMREKENTAFHESGHAIVGALTPNSDPVHKVTIIPRGMALCLTWSLPDDDRHSQTKNEILAIIKKALAGRIAE